MCYKCANVKRRRGCNKKTVQKEWLEDLVIRETMKLIQDDAVIDKFGFVQLYRTKNQRFNVRNRWFFVYGLTSLGFDHNFDHNAAILYCDKKRATVL